MSNGLKDLMGGLAEKTQKDKDDIFAVSVALLELMEDTGWDISAFSGVMAAYFCPDKTAQATWLERIAVVCDEEIGKLPIDGMVDELMETMARAAMGIPRKFGRWRESC